MLLALDPASHTPLYIQIRDQIRALISSGQLARGERIAPSRELARQLGIHRTTVANAYAELEADGWIEGHVGRGTYVARGAEANRPARSVARTAAGGNGILWESLFAHPAEEGFFDILSPALEPDVISFATARPPETSFPLAEFRRAADIVLRREGRRLLQLGPTDGYPPFKEFLLDWLRADGLRVDADEIVVTNGCQQSLDLVGRVFLRPGDSVAMENPVYPGAVTALGGAGVKCIPVPVGEDGLNLDALEMILSQSRVKLLLLTPNFHNPTGTTLGLEARRRVLELAGLHQVPIVEDNIYGALRLRGKELPSLRALDSRGLVIHLNSVSKICFPGLRVGWCVASRPVIERLRIAKQACDLHTGQLPQAVLAEFARRGWLAKYLKKMRAYYRERLVALEQALEEHFPPEAKWTRPEGGMSVWVRLPEGMDAGELLVKAKARKVWFTPGRYFYFAAPRPHTLRLGFCALTKEQIERGVEVLGGLVRAELRQSRRAGRERTAERLAERVALV